MNGKTILAALALLAATLVPAAAQAANGYATGNVNMRTGPGTQYQAFVVVPAGSSVDIIGCLAGYNWCDVVWGPNRGWVSASYLQTYYQQRRYAVPQVAPRVGLPVVTFSVEQYWTNHYRDRPWYRDRYVRERRDWQPPRQQYRQPPRRERDWRDERSVRDRQWDRQRQLQERGRDARARDRRQQLQENNRDRRAEERRGMFGRGDRDRDCRGWGSCDD